MFRRNIIYYGLLFMETYVELKKIRNVHLGSYSTPADPKDGYTQLNIQLVY